MKPGSPDSPAGKLAIAAVTEPEHTTPAPVGAREEATRFMLQTAADAGIVTVATRPDGNAERLLGQSWPFPSPFKVTVRTVALSEGLDRVEARARRSLERLGLPRGEALLLSNASDLAGTEGRALWERLLALKDRGLFKRIGFCATVEDGPALLARRFQPDLIQLPCNILDQRALQAGVLDDLASQGVAIHLSSVFAGGLLFASRETLPPQLVEHGVALSRARRRLAEARIDPMQAALAFALGLPQIETVVASVASAAELRAIVAAAHAARPDIDWSALAIEDPAAKLIESLTADRRVSSAA